MKRLLSLLMAVVFAMSLSGCFQPLDKDGMVFGGKKVEFLNIENKDVFDGGYYVCSSNQLYICVDWTNKQNILSR